MTKQFSLLQEQSISELEKLNARLRKEYDAVKLVNKRKMKELQGVSSELSQIERVLSGSDRTSGPIAAVGTRIGETETRIAEVQDGCQVRGFLLLPLCLPLCLLCCCYLPSLVHIWRLIP